MSAVGVRIDKFDQPVCNAFETRILNDQVCYEVNLDKFSNKDSPDKQLKLGFAFVIDYNEDRQVTFNENPNLNITEGNGDRLIMNKVKSEQTGTAMIYINTIGKFQNFVREANSVNQLSWIIQHILPSCLVTVTT